jgi:hypothetical protein
MSRNNRNPELYEEFVTRMAREEAHVINLLLASATEKTVAMITRALGEFVSDDQALADLIKGTVAGGNPLQKVIADLVWAEAERRAVAEAVRREERAAEDRAEDRAESRAWDRLIAMDHAYG